jgi:hypothetical protein
MNRLLVLLIAFAFVFSFVSLSNAQQKDTWYIGFGFGSGSAEYEGDSLEDNAKDWGVDDADASTPITFNFGVGAILNPNLHLGLDISALRESVESDEYDADATAQINNYLLAATFFPAGAGLSLKGGIGLCALTWEVDRPGYDEDDTYGGWAFLIGVGYQFGLCGNTNLGIHLEYSRQSYGDDDAPDDTNFINVYVSLYWF